ncbi:N-acetylmuramoyl-L-alanine amidase [Streptomyces silvisoli]|uniref:N-acetylmuramoyl-L-alanine amidase n=1 Tax=Streptomyces silvisoli TaxID=3034235 RepID=A0ABT5ZWM8_9ACTN|nr:peptidoglycan recognition family protein [Streptomyces silvisoli]MDF3294010.1 peptidoglycan recognition family protein [Streptomyces silvisoli]
MLRVVATAAALLPVFCVAPRVDATPPSHPEPLQQAFAQAARQYHVPQSVLLGVSYLESRWDGHAGRPSASGGYGPMHLTDARTAIAQSRYRTDGDAAGDTRGDPARSRLSPGAVTVPQDRVLPPSLRTADQAAQLTGLTNERLRTDPAANIAGGAALLAAYQRALGKPLSADPAAWFGAVARYSGADDTATAVNFAADVYQTIHDGASRTTDSGQRLTLAAQPKVKPDPAQVNRLGLRTADARNTECPQLVACEWIPAPYAKYGPDANDYGNHDVTNRPQDSSVDYIVIHDTEGTWDTTLKLVSDPHYLGWHYTVRSSDGHVAEHMSTKDVGWHAGNWYVNSKSVGVEHEGFLADPDAWYTEAMYRTSARLVRYLAHKYRVPLDRQHILGHDNVPGTEPSTVANMHTDPGPYWDWAHYFELMGVPFQPSPGANGGLVTIDPSYEGNQPFFTDCGGRDFPCAPHGSGAVRLYSAPSEAAPLVRDVGLHPNGDSTTGVNDTGARAATGQQFAVADQRGDWTAIWYLGQKAWFHNPPSAPAALNRRGWVVTPKPGRLSVPVYGRAYPEPSAYPRGIAVQQLVPLQYSLPAGQRYVIGDWMRGEYFFSSSFDRSKQTWVRGKLIYYEIQFGHRVAYVRADDVAIRPSTGA